MCLLWFPSPLSLWECLEQLVQLHQHVPFHSRQWHFIYLFISHLYTAAPPRSSVAHPALPLLSFSQQPCEVARQLPLLRPGHTISTVIAQRGLRKGSLLLLVPVQHHSADADVLYGTFATAFGRCKNLVLVQEGFRIALLVQTNSSET